MILGFYGNSNSGKTTLIEGIITYLKKENLEIVVIKHIPHKNFSIDNNAKDTGKFKDMGVDVVAFSPNETAFICKKMSFSDVVSKLGFMNHYDVILIEGLKKENIPKIRVGDCEKEGNTIMDYKDNPEDVIKWIKKGLKKERAEWKKKKKILA
ncbi:MAG: molybdopterin-guanine dinucleotide biosynthesis protein B [Candidatus Altiarchaeum hamiconexum]|uniref:Molybdopterin-guanine dinucleotide biosynthesis protein B n=1 Tax=Candidatus Altarchaeum hamiconexum TaxID=1803513 RepID=A0A8J8CF12_9ARCH|nr:molybdopterin-guanine dinucleotide biosynthesis protein B [Candidatus Altarchaeum hamiconexum]OIQ05949.1 MAG: molybdopterin-guanine dinucleotide biosynthesis protein B [Candidatus Altarchaeum sp. CG2_30_32_3053]PIN68075.1 MAG: molybdopterin-guanine dinucleotide biosynthesis protein B [Candidatus Altarchaeum sp. CG12_big_fil_rev_8_21_14_0_65_33_22]PIV27544.1 MAG: molybdopterin-guanine dinucleotide biosynthesis protein B [Candidatus Altarchaeum sp. CG03_land_8_20_14_0_80_32_618]PIX49496.1 MAG: